MSEKLLEISGLSVCYEGEQILNNICFSVEKGETVGIAGESGSGKSTLLRAILRLMGKNGSITGGQITFRGEELTGMSEKKLRSLCGSEIGMIFQNTGASLCPTRKIGAQICESVRAHEKRCGFIPPDFWGNVWQKKPQRNQRYDAPAICGYGAFGWRDDLEQLSIVALRRHEPARRDCARNAAASVASSGGRADECTRCGFAGAGAAGASGVAAERADGDGAGDAQSCGSRADGRPGCCFEGWKHRGAGGDKDGFRSPKGRIYKKSPCGCAGKREERCIIITCWK